MKILTRTRIIEAFHFPFWEALIFSILLWTSWGLAESFYLHRISGLLGHQATFDSWIYLEAFFIYVAIAAFLSTFIYVVLTLVLSIFHLQKTLTFRAATLCSILAVFFVSSLYFFFTRSLWQSELSGRAQNAIAGVLMIFALLLIVVLYHWASGLGFRIRRSGTMMLSILIISVLLSFIHFPLFSDQERSGGPVERNGFRKLMAYHYFAPLLAPPQTKN